MGRTDEFIAGVQHEAPVARVPDKPSVALPRNKDLENTFSHEYAVKNGFMSQADMRDEYH